MVKDLVINLLGNEGLCSTTYLLFTFKKLNIVSIKFEFGRYDLSVLT